MDVESPGSDGRESLVRRACDQCRQRKIRCDKRSPCSNCRTSKIVCRSTGAGQKSREPRKRVLISNEYERKIDLIEERLGSIEHVLRELQTSLGSGAGSQTCHHATPVSRIMTPSTQDCISNTTAAMDQQESKNAFEGSSLMATHSVYASNFLETVVSRSALQMSVSKINAALSTLKQLVNIQDNQPPSSTREIRLPKQKPLPNCDLRELTMPPMNVVLPLLRKGKETYPSSMLAFCPFLTPERLTEKCREVYFATEDFSDATFIVANGGLYQLFVAASFMTKDRALQEEYQRCFELCRANLETALANLHLLMPANPDSIEALAMGAAHAIEISKPSFALTLTSTASRLCQALGYHQSSSLENHSIEEKKRKLGLFWSVYCMDRALSLRLGRAPTIPDYDVDLPTKFDGLEIPEPWNHAFTLWIELAKIQGRVYEKLYCPAALCKNEDERVAEARRLAAEMQYEVMQPFQQIYHTMQGLQAIEDLYIKSDELCRFSILTLIYRAIPPPPDTQGTFINECIETARNALQAHKSCMVLLKEANAAMRGSYLHWSILYAPFVPFIVLFCHIIEVSSWLDLDRLDEFVASLEPNCSLSTAISKLHRLCHALSNVARLYIEAKAQAPMQENQALASVGHEFDAYLSALGLAPPLVDDGDARWSVPGAVPGEMKYGGEAQTQTQSQAQAQAQAPNIVGPGPGPAMSHSHMTQLGNWFSGNQYMMGLLEEDISLFDNSV